MEIFIAHQYVQFITDDGSCNHGMAFLIRPQPVKGGKGKYFGTHFFDKK
jgi:hypothetical protein